MNTKAAMSAGAQKSAQVALSEIEDAAADDIADMERGLRINRQVTKRTVTSLVTTEKAVTERQIVRAAMSGGSQDSSQISLRTIDKVRRYYASHYADRTA